VVLFLGIPTMPGADYRYLFYRKITGVNKEARPERVEQPP
jgi:hypothetical protein